MIMFETTIAVDFENEDYKGFVRMIGTGYDEKKISEDDAPVDFKERIFKGIEKGCRQHFSHMRNNKDIVADAMVTVTIEKNKHWLDTDEFPIRYKNGKVTAVMDDDDNAEVDSEEEEIPESLATWGDIFHDLTEISQLPVHPINLQRKPLDYSFDEEKPIRWNRKKVIENNARYDFNSALMRNTINNRIDMMTAKAAMRIVRLSNFRIDYQNAELLWRDVFTHDLSFPEAIKFIEAKIKSLDNTAEEK